LDRDLPRARHGGFTLVEVVLVLVLVGLLAVATPPLMLRGVNTMVFLPRSTLVNRTATDALQQIVEGGFSTLSGQPIIRGVRFAVRRSSTQPALWLAQPNQLGFLTSDNESVLIRWDPATETIRRSITPASCTPTLGTEEVLPYHAAVESVRILTTGALFRYYNQAGVEIVAPLCPPGNVVRRVDIAFTTQTGSGLFTEGNATEPVTSSVAIRVP